MADDSAQVGTRVCRASAHASDPGARRRQIEYAMQVARWLLVAPGMRTRWLVGCGLVVLACSGKSQRSGADESGGTGNAGTGGTQDETAGTKPTAMGGTAGTDTDS